MFSSLPGGLALVVIGVSMTGAGAATAIDSIMLPAMNREGYDEDFGCALQATAGI